IVEYLPTDDQLKGMEIGHAANMSLCLLSELITHVRVLIADVLADPAREGVRHEGWRAQGREKKSEAAQEKDRVWQAEAEKKWGKNPKLTVPEVAELLLDEHALCGPLQPYFDGVALRTLQNHIKKPKP